MSRFLTTIVATTAVVGCASLAEARAIHGFMPGPTTNPLQTIYFGALTPAAYGGTLGGSALLVDSVSAHFSTTCKDSASNNALAIDDNGYIVPNDLATHTINYSSGKYGAQGALAAAVTYLGSHNCSVTFTNTAGDSVTDLVVIQDNTYTVRGMYGMPHHADGSYNFGSFNSPNYFLITGGYQLGNILASTQTANTTTYPHATLGQTFICRDSQMNPLGASLGLQVKTPQGNGGLNGWAGTGRFLIKSEHALSLTDRYGNAYQSGGCQMAQISFVPQSSTYDIPMPFDFQNIDFMEDLPSLGSVASYGALLAVGSGGETVTNSYFGIGDVQKISPLGDNVENVDAPAGITGIFAFSQGYSGDGAEGLSNEAITFSHNYVYHATTGAGGGGAPYSFAGEFPSLTMQWNIFNTPYEKGIQIGPRDGDTITDNFIFGIRGTWQQHPDFIIIGNSCVYVTASNCVTGSNYALNEAAAQYEGTTTFARNILVHGLINYGYTGLTFSALGSTPPNSPANGSYQTALQGAFALTGVGRGMYVTLTVTGCPAACAYAAAPVLSPAQAVSYGYGYLPGDIVAVNYAGGSVQFTVGGSRIDIPSDGLGIVQLPSNNAEGPQTVYAFDNIVDNAGANSFIISYYGSAYVNNNDFAVDFHSGDNSGQNGTINALGNASSTLDYSYNTTQTYGLGGYPSGTYTVTPGSVTFLSKTDAAYQAVWPNWNPTIVTNYTRANYIAQHEPVAGYQNSALCHRDNAGVIYWHVPGSACDPTATHSPAQ